MNMKRFQRLLNDGQPDWVILFIRHNPITKIATLTVNHTGPQPGKMRKIFKLDKKFARKQTKRLIDLARRYGPSVVPKIKMIAINVR